MCYVYCNPYKMYNILFVKSRIVFIKAVMEDNADEEVGLKEIRKQFKFDETIPWGASRKRLQLNDNSLSEVMPSIGKGWRKSLMIVSIKQWRHLQVARQVKVIVKINKRTYCII